MYLYIYVFVSEKRFPGAKGRCRTVCVQQITAGDKPERLVRIAKTSCLYLYIYLYLYLLNFSQFCLNFVIVGIVTPSCDFNTLKYLNFIHISRTSAAVKMLLKQV